MGADARMIRPATFADIPRIVDLLVEGQARSKFAGIKGLEVDVKFTKSLLMNSIQRHGHKFAGATLLMVSEREARIEGAILGVLDRVQGIGSALYATDLFFIVTPHADPKAAGKLLDAVIAWAEANDKVAQVGPFGATDTIGDYRRTELLFRRRGMAQVGTMFAKEARPCLASSRQ